MSFNKTKIADIAKDLQTDELKLKIYRQIEKFVYKYHNRYFPHFKGDVKDLIVDIFTEFCRPKKHRNGETFSELDRVDPSAVGGGNWTGDDEKAIATYVQRYVVARLIDKERNSVKITRDEEGNITSKVRETRASENYDEDKGGLTLDRAVQGGKRSSGDPDAMAGAYEENINYRFYDLMDNPQAIKNARKALVNNPKQLKYIKSLLKHYDDKLDPEVKEFIVKLIGEEEEASVEVESTSEVQQEISNFLGEGVKISNYKLQNRPAVKMTFSDKDAMEAAKDKKSQVIEQMDKDGYEFYKSHGSNWYFFKKL